MKNALRALLCLGLGLIFDVGAVLGSVYETNNTQCYTKVVTVRQDGYSWNGYSWQWVNTAYWDVNLSYGQSVTLTDWRDQSAYYGNDFTVAGISMVPSCEVWTAFDEPQAWSYGTWTGDCSNVLPCNTVRQSRTNSRQHRIGERSNFGNERNVSWTTEYQPEYRDIAGCKALTWTSVLEELSGWSEVSGSSSPSCLTVCSGVGFTQNYTEQQSIRTYERSDCGSTRNVVNTTRTRPASRNATGCKTPTWSAFSEPSGWSEVSGSSSPSCSDVCSGVSFSQSYTERRTVRSGERSDCGGERNVSTTTEYRGRSRSATGCGSGTWSSFSTVSVDWHEISSSPNCNTVPQGTQFEQNYTEERTLRVGEQNSCSGAERNVSYPTETRPRTRTVTGCGPLVDSTAPSAPGNQRASSITNSSFVFQWNASTDNVGVTGYRARLNQGTPGATISGLSQSFSGLSGSTTYTVEVQARDAAGNWSAWSGLNVTTATGGTSGSGNHTFWLDVNNDGLLDEVFGGNSQGLAYYVSSWYTTNTYVNNVLINDYWHIWDVLVGQDYFSGYSWAWKWFDSPFWNGYSTAYNLTFVLYTPFTSWPGEPVTLYRDNTEENATLDPANWQLIKTIDYLFAANNIYQTTADLDHGDQLQSGKFYMVKWGKPLGSVSLTSGGSPLGAITSLGTSRGGGGLLSVVMPSSGSLVISAKDVIGRVLQNGPQLIWEVWDAINNVKIGSSTLGDTIDLGINVGTGTWQVGMKRDDGSPVWFNVNVTPRPYFITPAGDPVNSPVEAGGAPNSIPDGANEFTYSDANPGVLTIKLKARVPGIGSETPEEKARYKFLVTGIGDSTVAWNAANPEGMPTINGEILEAKVTFTGLPTSNSAFGKKTARLNKGSTPLVDQAFEVFFDKYAKNHPSGQAGSPNWFYYWMQTSANKTTTTTLYNAYPRSFYDIPNTYKIYIGDDAQGVGPERRDWGAGIDSFAWTTAHEGKHHNQMSAFWPNGWNNAQDLDENAHGDFLPDSSEPNYMPGRPYDPNKRATYSDEVGYYATPGSGIFDVEDICMRSQTSPYALDIQWENGTADAEDWANPGKNSKEVH